MTIYTKEIDSFGNDFLNITKTEVMAEEAIIVQKIVERAYRAL